MPWDFAGPTQGYFFRVAERNGSVGNIPFTGSAVNNRLRKHLLESKETPHGFRAGLSNTLRLLGRSQEDLAQYPILGLEKVGGRGGRKRVYAAIGC